MKTYKMEGLASALMLSALCVPGQHPAFYGFAIFCGVLGAFCCIRSMIELVVWGSAKGSSNEQRP